MTKFDIRLPDHQALSDLDIHCMSDSTRRYKYLQNKFKELAVSRRVVSPAAFLHISPTNMDLASSPYSERTGPNIVAGVVKDDRDRNKKLGYNQLKNPLKSKAYVGCKKYTRPPPSHLQLPTTKTNPGKMQSLLSLELANHLQVKERKVKAIRVPSFRKRLYQYLVKSNFNNNVQKHWAAEVIAHDSERENRLKERKKGERETLNRGSGEKRWLSCFSLEQLATSPKLEDACVGDEEPIPSPWPTDSESRKSSRGIPYK